VVIDRNHMSGGGMTTGIDFGLALLADLAGEKTAKMPQLAMEYDPQPLVDGGSPGKVGSRITQKVVDWMSPVEQRFRQACEEAAKALPPQAS
jgi:cyclohexyl-isocyanide hydratase